MYKSTFQCKFADLGMVLDSGQGSSQWLDQVGRFWHQWSGSLWETHFAVYLCFPPSLCSLSSIFAFVFFFFLFSFQHIEAKIEDFCAAVQHTVCLAILWFVFCSTLPGFTVFTSAQHSREFLSLFLIAVYAKGAKFSVRTINHYQTQKEEFENVFPLSRN